MTHNFNSHINSKFDNPLLAKEIIAVLQVELRAKMRKWFTFLNIGKGYNLKVKSLGVLTEMAVFV